ncbi:endonuclease domain-containing protein [Methylocaldum sp. MU1018]
MNEKRHSSPSPRGESEARGRGWGEGANQLEHAKFLRSNQTEAEQRLWYYLRAHRFMGLKFKRQKPIGPFIADFVCLDYRLVIEADGGQHGNDADIHRDAWFQAHGFTVLRFWNHEILGQTEAVLERIRQTVTACSPELSEANGSQQTKRLSCKRPAVQREDV